MKNLKIKNGTCYNTPWMKVFDLSGYKNLNTIDVGSDCFYYMNRVKIGGLNELESVIIGNYSFPHPSSMLFESENMESMMRQI